MALSQSNGTGASLLCRCEHIQTNCTCWQCTNLSRLISLTLAEDTHHRLSLDLGGAHTDPAVLVTFTKAQMVPERIVMLVQALLLGKLTGKPTSSSARL